MNEDANAKLIRELKEEINKLRNLLKDEGIEVEEGTSPQSSSFSDVTIVVCSALQGEPCGCVLLAVVEIQLDIAHNLAGSPCINALIGVAQQPFQ